MCKTTDIIDSLYRYIVVALLAWILYLLLCISNWVSITHKLDEKQIAQIITGQNETIRTAMREAFQEEEDKWNVFTFPIK